MSVDPQVVLEDLANALNVVAANTQASLFIAFRKALADFDRDLDAAFAAVDAKYQHPPK